MGKQEGSYERTREIVLRMNRLGNDPESIALVVDMSVESVKQIIAS